MLLVVGQKLQQFPESSVHAHWQATQMHQLKKKKKKESSQIAFPKSWLTSFAAFHLHPLTLALLLQVGEPHQEQPQQSDCSSNSQYQGCPRVE
jgi:hypothetical protein